MGSKWGPNRIFDAEGVRKPLDRHLGGYHSALGAILSALGAILSAIRSLPGGESASGPPTTPRPQPAGRGWGGDKSLSPGTGGEEGLASKKDYFQTSTRPEAQRPRRIPTRTIDLVRFSGMLVAEFGGMIFAA